MADRNILNIAWLGQGDFGDEAMAYALRSYLGNHGVGPITYYQSGEMPKYQSEIEAPIKAIHEFRTPERFRRVFAPILLRKYDTLLIGGGSLFHSENSIRWKQEIIVRVRARYGARAVVALLGVSVGPFESPKAELLFRELLSGTELCMVRDAHSARVVRTLGYQGVLHDVVDLSFLLPRQFGKTFPVADISSTSHITGLSFIRRKNDQKFETDGHFLRYLSLVNSILDQGQGVRLFTLYTGGAYLDKELNRTLKEQSKDPERVQIHEFDGDIIRTASAIAECSVMLSMRLHGIVFAYLSQVPFVSLGYDPKNRNFCDTVRYPAEHVFEISDKPDPSDIANHIRRAREDGKKCFDDTLSVSEGGQMVERALASFVSLLRVSQPNLS